jgi:SNF2 family DNA or RNA helicase
MGFIAQLRHIVGIEKVKPVIQQMNDWLESSDPTDKIAIGVHHRSVASLLAEGLADYKPLMISSESPEKKMEILEEFRKPERRVLIASILGAGQGLNIQFCKNVYIMEREWNPAKEEQFIGRFHRIEKDAAGVLKKEFIDATDSVRADTLNGAGTIDEYFDTLLELKKQIVAGTLDHSFDQDDSFIIELARTLVQNRLSVVGR